MEVHQKNRWSVDEWET